MEEEKKEIRIKLSTVFLIIAIILITIIALLYVQKKETDRKITELENYANEMQENLNNLEEKVNYENDEEENDEKENNIENTTTEETVIVPQLSGKFFEIESICKEYRHNSDVKNFKDFEYDLDSDGITDKITLRHNTNENEDNYSLEYNGKEIRGYWEGLGSVGIVDLDSADKYLDIWVYDDGPSDDPKYYFYRKVGNQITKIGEFDIHYGFVCDGKGKVLAAGRNMPRVNPTVYDSYYTIENNTFKKHSLDFSHDPEYQYTAFEIFFTTSLDNFKKFENDSSSADPIAVAEKYNIKRLNENTKFKIIEFVQKNSENNSVTDLKITLSDGTTGYLIHPDGRLYFWD